LHVSVFSHSQILVTQQQGNYMAATLHRFFTILIAVLIAVMLFRYWHIGLPIFSGHFNNEYHLRIVALILIYFGLNLAAIIGLVQLKTWRTLITCIAILFSTIFFATAYIPFIGELFAYPYRSYAMILGNLIVLLIVFLLRK
jgi:hypothetical protein